MESSLDVVILIYVRRDAQPSVKTVDSLQQTSFGKLGLMHRIHAKSSDAPEQPWHTAVPPKTHATELAHDGITDDQVWVVSAAVNAPRERARQGIPRHQEIVRVQEQYVFAPGSSKALVHRLVDTHNSRVV